MKHTGDAKIIFQFHSHLWEIKKKLCFDWEYYTVATQGSRSVQV
jgi:urease beta subunit